MTEKKQITDRLNEQTEDLICELGKESHLGWLYDANGQERMLMPIPMGRYMPTGPYPEAFYMAQKWLRRHREALQKAIVEDFKYGSRVSKYGRGREVELVRDLAAVITPICRDYPSDVDPVLVSVVLVRLGVSEFCKGYESKDEWGKWSLEDALGIDSHTADEAASKGGELLWQGKLEESIPFYEKALSKCAFHMDAMNDMAYIYATYFPTQRKGLDYAQRVLFNALKGDPHEAYFLDTAGWASYRFNRNLKTAEELLRESLSLISPERPGYISIVYHLMCVLKDAERTNEVASLWTTIKDIQAMNPIDKESHERARSLALG